MNINYDYLRIFYYVCKEGSFTKAAIVLSNSQPNITRAMNNLESQLGITLFLRSKKGITLTEEGRILFKRVSIAKEQLNLAMQEIKNYREMNAGSVTIGASEIALHEVLLPTLSNFKKQYPNIIIRITNETTPSAIKSLKEGIVDFAIVTTPLDEDEELEYRTISKFKEEILASRELLEHHSISSITELSNVPIIMMAKNSGTRAFYDELFAKHNVELSPQIIASTVDQILPMVKLGLGIGFVPENMQDGDEKIVKLKLPNINIERSICLVTRKDRANTISSDAIIKALLERKHI